MAVQRLKVQVVAGRIGHHLAVKHRDGAWRHPISGIKTESYSCKVCGLIATSIELAWCARQFDAGPRDQVEIVKNKKKPLRTAAIPKLPTRTPPNNRPPIAEMIDVDTKIMAI